MTAGFERRNHGTSHSYYVDGVKIPGVTTILGVLDKPALVGWAAKATASYAVDNWDRLSGISMVNRYEELVGARYKANKEATVRGQRIHALAERLIKGEEVDPDDQTLRAAAQAYANLLDAWDLTPVVVEGPCVNFDYQYAGTMDGIFTSPKLGTVIVDVKTGKKAYSEVALQLAAYRYCNAYLVEEERFGPRGGRLKSTWVEQPMPTVDGAAVIHIERETDESPAQAHLLPVQAGEDIWEQFLYLREVYAGWIERTSWDHRKQPSFNPPVGDALHPEQPTDHLKELIRS